MNGEAEREGPRGPGIAALAPVPLLLVVGGTHQGVHACSRNLGREGYLLHVASDAEEALRMSGHHEYQAVLVDLSRPGPAELECLRLLREGGCRAGVIVLSAQGCIEGAVEAVKAGAWDYLAKPFAVEKLLEKVALLRRQRREGASGRDDPVVAYVRQHATAIASRAEVASRFGVSSDTVSSRVRQVTGCTFTRFLHECRLEQALRLLENTALNVSQVAARVGFSTPQHFSRVFRRCTGLSPARYRLQQRAAKELP